MDAHKKAEQFLTEKRRDGYVGYQSTYGNYGFSVTYWPKEDQAKDSLSSTLDSVCNESGCAASQLGGGYCSVCDMCDEHCSCDSRAEDAGGRTNLDDPKWVAESLAYWRRAVPGTRPKITQKLIDWNIEQLEKAAARLGQAKDARVDGLKVDPKDVKDVQKLWTKGMSTRDIASKLGLSETEVDRALRVKAKDALLPVPVEDGYAESYAAARQRAGQTKPINNPPPPPDVSSELARKSGRDEALLFHRFETNTANRTKRGELKCTACGKTFDGGFHLPALQNLKSKKVKDLEPVSVGDDFGDEFKIGDNVVIQSGYGGNGGMAGQDFKRWSADTPAIVSAVQSGGRVWVKPQGNPYTWQVQAKALRKV